MNELTIRPERLERLRALCLALPGAVEQEAWGDPTWRVRGRIFAMQKGNYPGGRPSVWMKAAAGEQARLVAADPSCFVPPYVGSKGWIGVYLDGARVPWARLGERIETSHRLVAAGRPRRKP